MPIKTVPKFKNSDEESRWWFEHRDQVAKDLIDASRNGNSGEGTVARYARKLRESAASATPVPASTHGRA